MQPAASLVTRERKNWNTFDYADFSYPVNITSSSLATVHMTSTANVVAGMTLYQTDISGNFIGQAIVVSVQNLTTITVDTNVSWIAGAATVYQPIPITITYTNVTANAAWVSHFMDFEVMFREATFTNLSLGFASDFDPSIELTVLKAQIGKGWGSVAW